MKYEPVKINIENNKKYTDIAFIFDREDFLEKIYLIREIFEINAPYGENTYRRWLKLQRKNLSQSKKLEHIYNLLNQLYNSKIGILHKSDINQKYTSNKGEKLLADIVLRRKKHRQKTTFSTILFLTITQLLSMFKLSANYYQAIEKAILSNEIEDYDFPTVVGCVFSPFWFLPNIRNSLPIEKKVNLPLQDGIMFYFFPHTTKKEIHKAINKHYKRLVGQYNAWFHKANYNFDTVSNIKLYRKWYWQKKQGKTYLQIAKEEKQNRIDPEVYKETVRKGIKRYEKSLSTPL